MNEIVIINNGSIYINNDVFNIEDISNLDQAINKVRENLMDLKRDLVKYVRDKAKSKYDKGTECQICGSTENLDFHHFYGMTELLDKWLRENKLIIDTAEEIMEVRDTFIEQHIAELYEEAVTLCHNHHLRLHSIYGKRPKLFTAQKQKRWVLKQREKHGMV